MGLQTYSETECVSSPLWDSVSPSTQGEVWMGHLKEPSCSKTAREKVLVTIIPAGVVWGYRD